METSILRKIESLETSWDIFDRLYIITS